MSFFLTKRQFLDGSKTQTRRLGWTSLRVGEVFLGVEKCQGLRKGQRQVELGARRVIGTRRERLDAITREDVIAEGFPDMTPAQFVELFCAANKCTPETIVTRIEFTPRNEAVAATKGGGIG